MEFYLSLNNQKKGPFSLYQVGEMLEDGKVDGDTLVWHRDLSGWLPLADVPALDAIRQKIDQGEEISPPPLPEVTESSVVVEPRTAKDQDLVPVTRKGRPFIRFWARMFDYTLVSVIVWHLSDVGFPEPMEGESFADLLARYLEEMQKPEMRVLARTQFFALVGWHAIEAFLIHLIGTTPGKALFGISVNSDDGSRLTPLRSLGRAYYVYILGAGFYQFPFLLIGSLFSFFHLLSTGKCHWDHHLKVTVATCELSPVRILLAIGAFFALFVLQSLTF